MPPPIRTYRTEILGVIVERLAAIRRGETFSTDVGERLYIGLRPQLGPDDPDLALAVTFGTDSITRSQANVWPELPIEIHAIAKDESKDPWLRIELVLGDIKRAIELPDRTLGGLLRQRLERGPTVPFPREPGSTDCGLTITYLAPYAEGWGTP